MTMADPGRELPISSQSQTLHGFGKLFKPTLGQAVERLHKEGRAVKTAFFFTGVADASYCQSWFVKCPLWFS